MGLGPDKHRWPKGEDDPGYKADLADREKNPNHWGIHTPQAQEAAAARIEKEDKRTAAIKKKHG